MINRLYVDNFKCFVKFEYRPDRFQLILGPNGAGKTALLQALEAVRNLVSQGLSTDVVFPSLWLTAWDRRVRQVVELDIQGPDGVYRYRLEIEHSVPEKKNRIASESLRFDDREIYVYDGQAAHLFRDDFSMGAIFPTDSSKSALSWISPKSDLTRLGWFRERIRRMIFVAPDPLRMETYTTAEQSEPNARLHNFPSWYRHLAQESPATMAPLFDSLRQVISGFDSLQLKDSGEARLLRVVFHHSGPSGNSPTPYYLRFDELSEGQRSLITLFTIMHFAVQSDVTICFDEPDNFIALRELQPWLLELQDRADEQSCQCLLISHHPELIDTLAQRHGVVFSRDTGGHVIVARYGPSGASELSPSEVVARGWEKS